MLQIVSLGICHEGVIAAESSSPSQRQFGRPDTRKMSTITCAELFRVALLHAMRRYATYTVHVIIYTCTWEQVWIKERKAVFCLYIKYNVVCVHWYDMNVIFYVHHILLMKESKWRFMEKGYRKIVCYHFNMHHLFLRTFPIWIFKNTLYYYK